MLLKFFKPPAIPINLAAVPEPTIIDKFGAMNRHQRDQYFLVTVTIVCSSVELENPVRLEKIFTSIQLYDYSIEYSTIRLF